MTLLHYLVLFIIVVFVSACGIMDGVGKAGDAAEQTLSKVDHSNQLQETILSKNEEMLENLKKSTAISDRLRELNEEINASTAKTNLAIHQEILGQAMEGLLNPTNTGQLEPPTRMIPFGKAFAEEGTAVEIVAAAELLISDAKYAPGGITNIQGRKVDLTAVAIIGGFTSFEKFKTILKSEVDGHGEYEETAYEFSMLRYIFKRDVLFLPIIEKRTIMNKAIVLKAAELFRELKHIATLPFENRIRIEVPVIFYTNDLDPNEVRSLALRAKAKFTNALGNLLKTDPELRAAMLVFE